MESDIASTVEQFFREQNQERIYKKGQTLLLSDEIPKYSYYLVKGRVKQYTITGRGNEVVVNIFTPGSYFMITTAMTGLPNLYYFSAETDIILLQAPASETVKFITTHPEVMKDLLARIYTSFENLLRRTTYLMNGNARGRVIYEILLDLKGGTTKETHPMRRVLSITEIELASRAGLSRETVSREISALKRKGILQAASNITVADIARLEKALDDSF